MNARWSKKICHKKVTNMDIFSPYSKGILYLNIKTWAMKSITEGTISHSSEETVAGIPLEFNP
jgi:hypothetical protein